MGAVIIRDRTQTRTKDADFQYKSHYLLSCWITFLVVRALLAPERSMFPFFFIWRWMQTSIKKWVKNDCPFKVALPKCLSRSKMKCGVTSLEERELLVLFLAALRWGCVVTFCLWFLACFPPNYTVSQVCTSTSKNIYFIKELCSFKRQLTHRVQKGTTTQSGKVILPPEKWLCHSSRWFWDRSRRNPTAPS